MRKFKIVVVKTEISRAEVVIEAENEEQARELALSDPDTFTERDIMGSEESVEEITEIEEGCPECGQSFFSHNDDGSCVVDK